MEKLIIIGAGGHAVSVLDIILDGGIYQPIAVADKIIFEAKLYGVPVVDESKLFELYTQGIRCFFTAIGDNALRRKLSIAAQEIGYTAVNAISKYSYVSKRTELGVNIAVMPNASIIAGTKIGSGTIVNTNASIDHECTIGAYCHIAPGATLCGKVIVGNNTFVCAGAKIIDGMTIGENCVIAAGAVVTRDIEGNCTAMGIPAKPIKYHNT
ncbi:MAG: acetyltransferase [Clostridiales bacterium]|jgi:UDP-perosamine 4-acetyltransferase|nr:acetyltransferase [Clostridiales bacterium]